MSRFSEYAYENLKRKVYEGGAAYIPVCPICGRYVKADHEIKVNGLDGIKDEPNAICKKCGRVKMPFEGWI